MTKRERIATLLATIDDWIPNPPTRQLASTPGPQPSRAACPHCNRPGAHRPGWTLERKTRHGRQQSTQRWRPCPHCDGNGYREPKPSDELVDPYTYEFDSAPGRHTEQRAGVDRTRQDEWRLRDASITRCHLDDLARKGIIDGRPPHKGGGYSYEQAKARMDMAGDWPKLRRLLEQVPPDTNTLGWLEQAWDGPVRLPYWLEPQADYQTMSPNELRKLGWSINRIARTLKLRHGDIKKLIAA